MYRRKILIIDDEQINLDFFNVMLSRLGFDIHMASDGEEGLAIIKKTMPDLIILDNIMPHLTGWELTKMLKKDEEYKKYSSIPIIMFSAMDAAKDKIEGFELGVDDYITKPFNFSEVLARIRAVIRNHELGQQIVNHEKRISRADSLNKSLVYFTQHLKAPVLGLIDAAKKLDKENPQAVADFKEQVLAETEQTLAALSGLEDEVKILQEAVDDLEDRDFSLQELERRFSDHFRELHNKREEGL